MSFDESLQDAAQEDRVQAARTTLAWGLIGGMLVAAGEFAATRQVVAGSLVHQFVWLARLWAHWALAVLPLGIAVGVLEHRAPSHQPSVWEYVLAVLAGGTAGALVLAVHGKFVDLSIAKTAVGFDMAFVDRFLYGTWQLGFWGLVGAFLHATSLRRRRGAIALRAGELARLRSERRLAEEQLRALHAQIEPAFMLSTLSTVEQLYERDPVTADRVMDALIQFLRQATPLLRRQVSTIGQECRLLQAYLLALGTATGVADTVRIELDPRIEDAPVPPGALLALAQRLTGMLGHGAEGASATSPRVLVGRIDHRLDTAGGRYMTLQLAPDGPRTLTLRLTSPDREEPAHEGSQGS